MLAPPQTIMRASANLRCEGAAAKLDFIWILNTLPFRGLRCANMQRKPEAKHCSSLCSQSEGDEYCGGQARADNPTKSYPKALIMFATCSWPSLCKQSELQCWRRILRRKQFVNSCNSLLRRPRPQPSPHPPPQKACNPSLQSPHREFPNRQALLPYIEHLLPRQMRFRKTFLKPFRLSEAILCFF